LRRSPTARIFSGKINQAERGRRGDTCGNVDVVQAFRV
jgi:hypothetical protein